METLKEFDKEVKKSESWGGGKFGMLQEYYDESMPEGMEVSEDFEVDWDGIKDFIRDSHIKEWEETIHELADNLEPNIDTKNSTKWFVKQGYNEAIRDSINYFQEKINNANN